MTTGIPIAGMNHKWRCHSCMRRDRYSISSLLCLRLNDRLSVLKCAVEGRDGAISLVRVYAVRAVTIGCKLGRLLRGVLGSTLCVGW